MKNILNRLLKTCPTTGRFRGINWSNIWSVAAFPVTGLIALIWFLIRVVPKPSRATYPCMKVAAPLASTFVAYLCSFLLSAFSFKKVRLAFRQRRLQWAILFSLFLVFAVGWLTLQSSAKMLANAVKITRTFEDPLGPNNPIGEAKGIFPGRVVWIHDPNATNENCTNNSHSDAYWLSSNTDQEIVDQMFAEALKLMTGKDTDAEAWDAVFKYFNVNHGKGEVGYSDSETVFIKINAVTAWSGAAPTGEMPASRAIEYDTTPQTIMTMLRQLVNNAGVPQGNIYVGDPMCDIWNHLYEYFQAEFPNVKYCSKRTIPGRYKITASNSVGITYSDHGTVMNQVTTHKFFKEMMDADYLLNIPAMKGHRWGGVTFFAKNHFGSNTTDGSWQLHKGLMNPDDAGMRYGYHLYRVFVDLMGCKYLGGNTLLYFMDGLWSTSYEHQKPQKFRSAPFNNDWCSSILLSLDPVAIESVCLDILQKEFVEEEIIDGQDGPVPDRWTYVQWDGVDDYLHQAADSSNWPEGITYDPDNSGTPLGSLGVHEHWNNPTDRQYTRNLGTGDGIELIEINKAASAVKKFDSFQLPDQFVLYQNYPNPFNNLTTIKYDLPAKTRVVLTIYNQVGQEIRRLVDDIQPGGAKSVVWDGKDYSGHLVSSGIYFYQIRTTSQIENNKLIFLR